MDDFILYLLFKQIILSLDSEYTVRFRDVQVNKNNCVGVFIKGGEVDNSTRNLNNATYNRRSARVQVVIQGGDDEGTMFKALALKDKLRDTITRAYNDKYIVQAPLREDNGVLIYDSDVTNRDVEIKLIRVNLLGEPDFKGYTSQGISRDIINFRVEYVIIGG